MELKLLKTLFWDDTMQTFGVVNLAAIYLQKIKKIWFKPVSTNKIIFMIKKSNRYQFLGFYNNLKKFNLFKISIKTLSYIRWLKDTQQKDFFD